MKITKNEETARKKAIRHSRQHTWAYLLSADGDTKTFKNGELYKIECGMPVNVAGCDESFFMPLSQAKAMGIK